MADESGSTTGTFGVSDAVSLGAGSASALVGDGGDIRGALDGEIFVVRNNGVMIVVCVYWCRLVTNALLREGVVVWGGFFQ